MLPKPIFCISPHGQADQVEGIQQRPQNGPVVCGAGPLQLRHAVGCEVDLVVGGQVLGGRVEIQKVGVEEHGNGLENPETPLVDVGVRGGGEEEGGGAEAVAEEDEAAGEVEGEDDGLDVVFVGGSGSFGRVGGVAVLVIFV